MKYLHKTVLLIGALSMTSKAAPAQTLRQAVLYSDAIAIGSDRVINEKQQLTADIRVRHSYQTEFSFTSWLYTNVPQKTLPKVLVTDNKPVTVFTDDPGCLQIARGYDVGETLHTIYFLKREKGTWQVLSQRIIMGNDLEKISRAISRITAIAQITGKQDRFRAYVDWILPAETDGLGFIQAKRDLDSTSAFMQYYRQYGAAVLSMQQQELLAKEIALDIYDGNDYNHYFESGLLYLVYPEFAALLNEALINRLAFEYLHLEDQEYTISEYDLEQTVLAYYAHDRSEPGINTIGDIVRESGYISSGSLIEKVKFFLMEKGLIQE